MKKPRVLDLPKAILSACRDPQRLIAEVNGDWNDSDSLETGVPSARLVQVCEDRDAMLVLCDKGGYVPRRLKITLRSDYVGNKWGSRKVEEVGRSVTLNCIKITN